VSDPSYTTFLKHFGEFTVAKLDKREVTGQEYILAELKAIQNNLQAIEQAQKSLNIKAITELINALGDGVGTRIMVPMGGGGMVPGGVKPALTFSTLGEFLEKNGPILTGKKPK
jgi:hypothetical protein